MSGLALLPDPSPGGCLSHAGGVLEEGPFRRWRKGVGVGSKAHQVCPLPVSVAGMDHAQASSESTPELQITLLPLLAHIIMVKLFFSRESQLFLD